MNHQIIEIHAHVSLSRYNGERERGLRADTGAPSLMTCRGERRGQGGGDGGGMKEGKRGTGNRERTQTEERL